MRVRLKNVVAFSLFTVAASCSQLECDQQKQESITFMNEGIEAAKTQSYPMAINKLELALQRDPTNHTAAYNLGMIYVQQTDSRCRDLDPNDQTPAMKERRMQCKELWQKASTAFAQAVKHNSDDALYHYFLGRAYYEAGDLQNARTELERSVAQNKRLFKAHWILGRIHADQDRAREAAAAWSEACRLNPTFGKPFIDLGKLYYKWDYYEEARTVLEQGAPHALDKDDKSNIYYQLGMSYDAMQKWDSAIDAYLKALEAKGDNLDAKLQLGLTYANKGAKDDAVKTLQEYLKAVGNAAGGTTAFKVMAANARLANLLAR